MAKMIKTLVKVSVDSEKNIFIIQSRNETFVCNKDAELSDAIKEIMKKVAEKKAKK